MLSCWHDLLFLFYLRQFYLFLTSMGWLCGVGVFGLTECSHSLPAALSKLLKREGMAGAEGAILPYVGHLQLIPTLKIRADCCQLCQYKLTKPNLT